jgi:hypothetical protein
VCSNQDLPAKRIFPQMACPQILSYSLHSPMTPEFDGSNIRLLD